MRQIAEDPRETIVLLDSDTTFAVPSGPIPLGQKLRILDNLGVAGSVNKTVTGVLGGTVTFSTNFSHAMFVWQGTGWMQG